MFVVTTVAFSASLALVRAMDIAGIETPRTTLDVLKKWQQTTRLLQRKHGIAFLGDSTALPPEWKKGSGRAVIPGRIDERLKRAAPMPPVITFATMGLGPVDYYFLAPGLAAARPAAIIVSINLAAFSPEWIRLSSHPEFSSVVGVQRWPEALGLPLDASGVTTDRLLLYSGIEELGGVDAWWKLSRYQARVMEARMTLELALEGPSGPVSLHHRRTLFSSHSKNRSLEAIRDQQWLRYGSALSGLDPDSLSVQALRATLRYWKESRIPVLMVVLPVNVDFFDSLEILNDAPLKRTLAVLSEVARGTGTHFLDLHDLLPESFFTDLQGHYSHTEESDGPSAIAERIAPVLLKMARRR